MKITRKLICSFFALIIAVSFAACGKKAVDGKTIGIAKFVKHDALDAVEKGIQDELADSGYKLNYDLQNANADANTSASIANKFVSEKVAVAVGIATPTAQSLVNSIKDIPIVFSAVTDPVSAGLISTIDMGENNVTGVSDLTPVKAQIMFLNKLKPIKRLGHIYSSHEDNATALAKITKKACEDLGIEFVETTVTNSSEVKQAALTIADKVDAIYVSTDNTVISAISSICEVAAAKNIPVMSADPSSAINNDVFAAWGFDYYKMGRATGKMIKEILDGKKPNTIPIKFMTDPADIDLLINLDVANKLGIEVSDTMIKNANKIIKDGKMTQR